MKLAFAVHLDDYHANREVDVPSEDRARGVIIEIEANGYDVDRVTLDGERLTV